MTLLTLADAKRLPETVTGASLLILLSPCQESHYIDGETLGSKLGKPVIALNAPYSFRYDIGENQFHKAIELRDKMSVNFTTQRYIKIKKQCHVSQAEASRGS